MTESNGTLPPGTIMGGCRVETLLGKGGMGEVYAAMDLTLERRVALKIVRPDAASQENIARFLQEAKLASRIDHPNVVMIFRSDLQDGVPYIVMQYVDGQTLAQLVKAQRQPLEWTPAARVIRMAARGLHEVHNQGLIHRDVTPRNIMISADSRVRLMDFGLARQEQHSELTSALSIVGTPAYMSPEQCRAEDLDARTDIYSLGATLYHLLTAAAPFKGSPIETVTQIANGKRPVPVGKVNARIPAGLGKLLDRMMAVERISRPTDAHQVSRELGEIIQSGGESSHGDWDTEALSASAFTSIIGRQQIVDQRQTPSHGQQAATPRPALAAVQESLGKAGVGVGASQGRASDRSPISQIPPNPPSTASQVLSTDRQFVQTNAGSLWITVAVVLFCCVVIGAYAYLAGKTPGQPSPPGGGEKGEDQPVAVDGMVYITTGNVTIGNSADQVRAHFRSFMKTQRQLDRFVEMSQQVPHETLNIPAFWIDQYEVTNAEYTDFVKATDHVPPSHWGGQRDPPVNLRNHPVVNVTYEDAEAYATWAGKQLPTRQQWIRAFRGDSEDLFPWGNTYVPSRATVSDNPRTGGAGTTPVKDSPDDVSRFGVYNLVGNASEYVRDTFSYGGRAWRVGKGSEYALFGSHFGVACMQYLYQIGMTDKGLGFRCVREEK